MGYKRKFIKSFSWMSVLQLVTRGTSLVKYAVLARLLTSSDIGSFGIVILIIGVSEIFSEFGIQTFLIQYKKNIENYISSAWLLQVLRGFLLFSIILALSLPTSLFFKQNSLLLLIILGAFNPLIKGFENSYIVSFQKELMFEKQFIYKFFIVIVDFLVSVSLIVITHSVIGLVFGMLFSSAFGTLYSWVYIEKKPKLKFNKAKIIKMIRYGRWININSIIFYITTNMDIFILGRIMGTSTLGLYQISQKFSLIPMQEASDIFGQVTFPVYSKITGDLKRFRRAYVRILISLMTIEFFIAIFLFFFSREIILTFLGSRWLTTESIFRTFIAYGLVSTFVSTFGSFFLSIGRQDFLSKMSFLRIIILIPMMIYLISLFGVSGAIYSLILSLLVVLPFYVFNSVKVLNGSYTIISHD